MTGAAIVGALRLVAVTVWLLVLGRVLLSWVDPVGRTQAGRLVVQLTEPLLAPIRSVLPRTGMLDWSPFVLLLVLGVVMRVLLV
jgi:YggT family protein